MKSINILAGGPTTVLPANFSDFLAADADWIGVDAGSYYLVTKGVTSLTAVGDFDSLTADQLAFVKAHVNADDFQQAKPEKDFTDTELALQRVLSHFDISEYQTINLFGMTGGRLDHELDNLLNIFQDRYAPLLSKIRLFDAGNIVTFYHAGDYVISDFYQKKYLGFATLNGIQHFSIAAAKYELHDFSSDKACVFASNEFIEGQDVRISFAAGDVIAIYS
ncbi:thiamine diphosphokinase [Oenococcus sp.]|uniref:thiamine diphosphokinase n=1 Tax=Oenococcus sp. TaxID=1979414 RepID=UPI0039E76AA3